MLLQTLKTLIMAGSDALESTCSVPVTEEHITQVRHGHLTFPSLGELRFSGGTLQQVHLGCDAILCARLEEKISSTPSQSGLEVLSNKFLENVLEAMDTRRPQGWVEKLQVGPLSLHSRGVRSFGFRLETELGQFYLMAEVPSRAELDMAKEGEYLTSMVATYFDNGWITNQAIKTTSAIDNFLIFLRKTEIDIQVDVPEDGDMYSIHTGVLLETSNFHNQRALCVSMDVSGPEGKAMKTGDVIRARVGVQDRAIMFTGEYLGVGEYPVVGTATINCVYFSMPSELHVEQRRRAFRIDPSERIPVEISCTIKESLDAEFGPEHGQESSIRGRLADLSFSGARIVADPEKLMSCVGEDSHVSCRLHFPGEVEPLEIMGIIRRASTRLIDRDSQQNEIGLEFLVSEDDDREALEFIRQYVLSQQRNWLSQRIHVAGVEQW